jgi:hypothetical protein
MTHGLLSRRFPLIPGEAEKAWRDFRARFMADLRPIGALEEELAEQIVGDAWRLRRASALEAVFLSSEETEARQRDQAQADELLPDDPECLRLLTRIARPKNRYYLGRAVGMGIDVVTNLGRLAGRLQRGWFRSLKELAHLQGQRLATGSESQRPRHLIIDVDPEEAPANPHP